VKGSGVGVEFVAFLIVSIVIIVVPGIDFALLTRQVVGYGRRVGFITLAGLCTGGLVHAGFATAGLSVLLLTSAQLYTIVRWAGAVYLVYVGGTTLWGVLREIRGANSKADPAAGQAAGRGDVPTVDSGNPPDLSKPHGVPKVESEPKTQTFRSAFTVGVVNNLLNMKVVVFYVTFVPQFVTPGPGAAARTAMLAAMFLGLAIIWWSFYITLLDWIAGWLQRPRVKQTIEGLTGAVLIGLGAKIAFDV
jgi:threonine/homoserine/homoserine lactone efflux protein